MEYVGIFYDNVSKSHQNRGLEKLKSENLPRLLGVLRFTSWKWNPHSIYNKMSNLILVTTLTISLRYWYMHFSK